MTDEDLFEKIGSHAVGTQLIKDLGIDVGVRLQEDPHGFVNQEDLRELGRNVYNRLSQELFGLVCGDGAPEDTQARDTILQNLGLTNVALIAAISGLIQAHFSAGTTISTAAATLIVDRIVRPAGAELCKFWKTKL